LLFSGFELEGADRGEVQISLWAENMLDEAYIINAVHVDPDPAAVGSTGFVSAAYGDPRAYGMDVEFVF